MIREHKYKPQALITYCPACGRHIGLDEWNDYGMHLRCTEFYNTKQFHMQNKDLAKNGEVEKMSN